MTCPSTKSIEEARRTLERDGVVRIRGVVDPHLGQRLHRMVCRALVKYVPDTPRELLDTDWDDPAFNAAMRRLRATSPERFALLYDTVQTSVALQAVGTDGRLMDIAAELLDDAPDGISATDHLLRMDAPHDARNTLRWHQDSAYFKQNDDGANGLVCWVPMHDFPAEVGPVWVALGSHRHGRVDVESVKSSAIASEQLAVPATHIDGLRQVQATASRGDAYFMHMDAVHKSGLNSSDRFRWTAIVRFHRMFTEDFKPGRLVYRYTKAA